MKKRIVIILTCLASIISLIFIIDIKSIQLKNIVNNYTEDILFSKNIQFLDLSIELFKSSRFRESYLDTLEIGRSLLINDILEKKKGFFLKELDYIIEEHKEMEEYNWNNLENLTKTGDSLLTEVDNINNQILENNRKIDVIKSYDRSSKNNLQYNQFYRLKFKGIKNDIHFNFLDTIYFLLDEESLLVINSDLLQNLEKIEY